MEVHGELTEAVRLHRAGRLDDAEAAYRRVLDRAPANAPGLHGLGLVAHQRGARGDAAALIRRAIDAEPHVAAYWSSLGAVLRAAGEDDEAAHAYGRALAIAPQDPVALNNLGNLLAGQERLDEAIDCYRRALAVRASDPVAHNNLANALAAAGRRDEARVHYDEALRLRPGYPEAHRNLANLLADLGDLEASIARYRQAIGLRPDDLAARLNLGRVLRLAGRFSEAIALYEALLAQDPRSAAAHSYLGRVLMAQGRTEEAGRCYERALALDAGYEVGLVNRLMWLQYADRDPQEVFELHHRWGALVETALPPPAPHLNQPDPERRLKVGYVSADFRAHSTAWYIAPLLAAHRRSTVEVFCYADVAAPDATTARLLGLSDHWRGVAGLPDARLAELIRADAIDVLVDLDGHLGGRLKMFALRPAPVQVSWLGYLNTTGLRAMDYRLVDDVTDPPGAADALATETLVRLPGGWACYEPPTDAPEPGPPPCLGAGFVTFGAFAPPAKLSEGVLDAWSAVLKRTPGSRLLIKASSLDDRGTRERLLARFAKRGVAAERLDLVGWVADTLEHLRLYNAVDIVLDTFPHNGVTTTLEALWMGVPVVALLGDRHASRISASFLTRVGQPALIARDLPAYIEAASALAAEPRRLAELRRSLRLAMAASTVCDAANFASEVEAAYRHGWRKWCATAAGQMAQ